MQFITCESPHPSTPQPQVWVTDGGGDARSYLFLYSCRERERERRTGRDRDREKKQTVPTGKPMYRLPRQEISSRHRYILRMAKKEPRSRFGRLMRAHPPPLLSGDLARSGKNEKLSSQSGSHRRCSVTVKKGSFAPPRSPPPFPSRPFLLPSLQISPPYLFF
ncbi:hypothetical protein IF1G_07541 [Cordyceps javanica]|uniref:Uncharacterized protein n=1 Tax=Cordyceps javanica TaxID=43265 RepID=A0A545UWH1_9HYPO|nr:hypothetical protein IF1G_07541 [Cordyceps javanica]